MIEWNSIKRENKDQKDSKKEESSNIGEKIQLVPQLSIKNQNQK